MTDDNGPPERIPNSAFAEFTHRGELLFRIDQKPPAESTDEEIAASVIALRELAGSLESDWLDEPAEDLVDDGDFEHEHHGA